MTGDRPRAWNSTLPARSAYLPRGQITRTPFPSSLPAARTREARSAPAKRATSGRGDYFPQAVAALIDARDPWCIHCGWARDLQRHHRRLKGVGGDGRPHTDCACNGVRICADCHRKVHTTKRREAEAEGLIIPRATILPGTISVLVHLEADAGGLQMWPSCDGRWLDVAPEGLVA